MLLRRASRLVWALVAIWVPLVMGGPWSQQPCPYVAASAHVHGASGASHQMGGHQHAPGHATHGCPCVASCCVAWRMAEPASIRHSLDLTVAEVSPVQAARLAPSAPAPRYEQPPALAPPSLHNA